MKKMKTMVLVAAAGMFLSVGLKAGEVFYKSDFTKVGTEHWDSRRPDPAIGGWGKGEPVQIVKDDNQDCLKVNIKGLNDKCVPWVTGALLSIPEISVGQKAKISFKAKSIDGGRCLIIQRAAGGGAVGAVELTTEWKQYELGILNTKFSIPQLIFCLITAPENNVVEEGQFLLKDIEITALDEQATSKTTP